MACNKKGFTIVEFMIAVTIFSVAITLVLAGVIFIGRQYQQGSNRTSLEESSRVVHEQISQSLKFSSEVPINKPGATSNWQAWCIGTDMFVYNSLTYTSTPGNFSSIQPGLWLKDAGTCEPSDINDIGARNLLVDGAKVMHFTIDPNNQVTTVFLKAPADGDDLIDNSAGSTESITCDYKKPGREFCSSVKLQSSAVSRISN